jgi:hypothetical protein
MTLAGLSAEVEAWCRARGLGADPRKPPPDRVYRPTQPPPPAPPAARPRGGVAHQATRRARPIVVPVVAEEEPDACPRCREECELYDTLDGWRCGVCKGTAVLGGDFAPVALLADMQAGWDAKVSNIGGRREQQRGTISPEHVGEVA